MHSKIIPTYARYIQVHRGGPPDPPGMLAAPLLASAAEWLVDHVLIKTQRVKISPLARRAKLNLVNFLRNTLVLALAKIFPHKNFLLYGSLS